MGERQGIGKRGNRKTLRNARRLQEVGDVLLVAFDIAILRLIIVIRDRVRYLWPLSWSATPRIALIALIGFLDLCGDRRDGSAALARSATR